MKKYDVFTFTAPDGAEVTAAVVAELCSTHDDIDDSLFIEYLCYSQNRLFTYGEKYQRENACTPEEKVLTTEKMYGKVLVNYCIIPGYDALLRVEQMFASKNK